MTAIRTVAEAVDVPDRHSAPDSLAAAREALARVAMQLPLLDEADRAIVLALLDGERDADLLVRLARGRGVPLREAQLRPRRYRLRERLLLTIFSKN